MLNKAFRVDYACEYIDYVAMKKKAVYKKTVIRGAMRPLTVDQVKAISTILQAKERWRDWALFRLGIDSMLRASDLVRVYVEEVIDHRGEVVPRTSVMMKKTRQSAEISIGDETKAALEKWLSVRGGRSKWLFPGGTEGAHLTEIRYRQLAKGWFASVSLPLKHYSTHSIRRTKATAIYAETKNLKAISELLGHKDTKVTERYIGVTRAEAVEISAKVKI